MSRQGEEKEKEMDNCRVEMEDRFGLSGKDYPKVEILEAAGTVFSFRGREAVASMTLEEVNTTTLYIHRMEQHWYMGAIWAAESEYDLSLNLNILQFQQISV